MIELATMKRKIMTKYIRHVRHFIYANWRIYANIRQFQLTTTNQVHEFRKVRNISIFIGRPYLIIQSCIGVYTPKYFFDVYTPFFGVYANGVSK